MTELTPFQQQLLEAAERLADSESDWLFTYNNWQETKHTYYEQEHAAAVLERNTAKAKFLQLLERCVDSQEILPSLDKVDTKLDTLLEMQKDDYWFNKAKDIFRQHQEINKHE